MGLEELTTATKFVLEDLQRQISDKSQNLIQLDSKCKELEGNHKHLHEDCLSAMETKKRLGIELSALQKELEGVRYQISVAQEPVLQDIRNQRAAIEEKTKALGILQRNIELAKTETESKVLMQQRIKEQNDNRDTEFLQKQTDLNERQEILFKKYKVYDSLMGTYTKSVEELNKEKEIVARQKIEAERLVEECQKEILSQKLAGERVLSFEKELQLREKEINLRINEINKETAVLNSLRSALHADKDILLSEKITLEMTKKALDAREKELKYLELRYKNAAAQKGIAEELEKLGG